MPIPIHDAEALLDDASLSRTEATGESFPALEHFRIQNVPPAAYYIPDFITKEEEEYLLRRIGESPQPKWKKVGTGRRLQYWGGTMSKKGILLPEPLPDFLNEYPDIVERIESFLRVASSVKGKEKMELGINQVLINEYQPGQGISPHEDGPAFHPLVATLSLGSHTVLDLHHYLNPTSPSPPMISSSPSLTEGEMGKSIAAIPLGHLLLMPRSLLVLSSTLYTSHLHAISSRHKDIIVPRSLSTPTTNPNGAQSSGIDEEGAVTIANAELLGDAEVIDALREGKWIGERGIRTSLTFRRAEKVLKGGALGVLGNALKRP
ncbi:uncharacterized protein IL334_001868 [Kwoniella shivajii]|uniref:Fe2OG dioxygenase domain-containing protein n=1 Tax=Kwoniella shivajii TaxID=564305 RepID=A0ABZ1CT41_9TREE|nr:hypothetical protein IL334_001868 [Kwoniella shivajii]